MTSAFWGGFAGTLLKERQADDAADREIDSYKKKQEILKEMERREEPDADQRVFHIFDGNGKEIGTRPMTPFQIKQYDLEARKRDAEIGGAEARTQKDKREAELFDRYGEDEAKGRLAVQGASLDSHRASTASAYHGMEVRDKQLALEQGRDKRSADNEARTDRLGELTLADAEKRLGPATIASVQDAVLQKIPDIVTYGGDIARADLKKAINDTLYQNRKLTTQQAAQIVASSMQRRYGAKAVALKAANEPAR